MPIDIEFEIGTCVEIVKTKTSDIYKDLVGKTGVIKNIKSWKDNYGNEHKNYYVEIRGSINPKQENGWFLFTHDCLRHAMVFCFNDVDYIEAPTRCFLDMEARNTWYGSGFCEEQEPYIKIDDKKENEKMELLEIYYENQERKLKLQLDKKVENVKKQDETYKELFEIANKFSNVKGIEICVSSYVFDKQIETKLEKLYNQYEEDRNRLMVLHDEINAQIQICETYEQKINVLKTYEVIDEKGKLKQ